MHYIAVTSYAGNVTVSCGADFRAVAAAKTSEHHEGTWESLDSQKTIGSIHGHFSRQWTGNIKRGKASQ